MAGKGKKKSKPKKKKSGNPFSRKAKKRSMDKFWEYELDKIEYESL